MKKNLLFVGPLPPPIHGESIALVQLLKSEQFNTKFDGITIINTSKSKSDIPGKLS